MKLVEILAELNLENGSNYKNSILKKYSDNVELQRLLKMTYDKVTHTYGITMKNIPEYINNSNNDISEVMNILESDFYTSISPSPTGSLPVLIKPSFDVS